MKRTIIARLAVAAAAVAATIAGAAGSAHAEELWFYVGDYPGAPGTPFDVFCLMTITKAQCFPNLPTYPVPGERPKTCLSLPAGSVYLSGVATMGYECRADAPNPESVVKWQPGDYKRVGRFICAASDASGVPSVYCTRDDGSGYAFEVARTWYRLSDGSA